MLDNLEDINQRFKEVEMFDDGAHNDGFSGDGVYGGKISNSSNSIDYYFYAENDSAGVFSPKRAAYEFYQYVLPINNKEIASERNEK